MQDWPKDDKPALFQDITEPLQRSVQWALEHPGEDVPYNGLDVGEVLRPDLMSAERRLMNVYQIFRAGLTGPVTPLNEIIELAVQIGIEQGRRMTMSGGFSGDDDATNALTEYLEAMDVPVDPAQLKTILEDVRRRKVAMAVTPAGETKPTGNSFMRSQAARRPSNFHELSGAEQWAIDKELGILDWDGT